MEQFHASGDKSKSSGTGTSKCGKQTKEELLILITRNRLIQHQNNYFKDSHSKIDEIKDSCCHLHFGYQLTNLRAGAFCPEQMHGRTIIAFGNEDQHKYKNTHTADPVGKAAPEKRGMGHCGDVCNHAGTGGCETRHDLKAG